MELHHFALTQVGGHLTALVSFALLLHAATL